MSEKQETERSNQEDEAIKKDRSEKTGRSLEISAIAAEVLAEALSLFGREDQATAVRVFARFLSAAGVMLRQR